MERKLAAILAADVVGYSRLMGKDETGTLERLKGVHKELVRPTITRHSGRIVKLMGDGLLAEFPSVVEAVKCAADIQRHMRAREPDRPAGNRISLRIGINLGDIIVEGGDIYGDGVNVAARLESLAEPDGICISRAVRDQIRDKLEIRLEDIGEVSVKNIARPVRTFRILINDDDIAADEPSADTIVLSADIRSFALLMGDSGPQAGADRQACRNRFLQAIKQHKCQSVTPVGEGIIARFATPANAILGAMDAQAAVSEWNNSVDPERRIQFRIGIDLERRSEASRTNRKTPLSPELGSGPGEICVSHEIHERVSEEETFQFKKLGDTDDGSDVFRLVQSAVSTGKIRQNVPLQCQGLEFPRPARPSIIVVPFKILGDDTVLGPFAEGIRIDIQSALVKISGLFTIAAGTASTYTGRTVEPSDVAREMGVRYVLECTIQGSSERLRVAAQLSDGNAGQLIWAERYDRALDDSFVVQDEIVEEIVTALDVKLVSGEQAKVWRKTLRNPKALELYYKGLDLLIDFNKESVAAARQMFEAVSSISPDVTLGSTSVAFCHYWDVTMGWSESAEDSLQQAGSWAQKAAAMDDADGQAHIILAHVKMLNGRHDDALRIAEEAVIIRPSCANTNALFGNILIYCGRPGDAIRRIKRAMRIAPVYASWWVELLAIAYRDNGDNGQSISAAKDALLLNADSIGARTVLASALVTGGWLDFARDMVSSILDMDPNFSLAAYAKQHPYRNPARLDSILSDLSDAGLPD